MSTTRGEQGERFVHVAWTKHNGCGEWIYRQAGHPSNETGLEADGWHKLYAPVHAE